MWYFREVRVAKSGGVIQEDIINQGLTNAAHAKLELFGTWPHSPKNAIVKTDSAPELPPKHPYLNLAHDMK